MAESEYTSEKENTTDGCHKEDIGGQFEELNGITFRIIELNEKFIILHRQWFQLKNRQIGRRNDRPEGDTNNSKLRAVLRKIKSLIFGRSAAAGETDGESSLELDEITEEIKKVNDEIVILCRRREEISKNLKT
jgi:hypothetical protein